MWWESILSRGVCQDAFCNFFIDVGIAKVLEHPRRSIVRAASDDAAIIASIIASYVLVAEIFKLKYLKRVGE